MRIQWALVSASSLILGLLLTAGESPSERIVSKYSSTARAKSISFQETGEEGDPGFDGLFLGFGGYKSLSAETSARGSISNSANKRWTYIRQQCMRAPALFRIRPMTQLN